MVGGLRIAPLSVSDEESAAALLALQRRAYRTEAELIGSDAIPPLRETVADLRACDETFLGAWLDGTLAGVVSWRVEGETIDLHRLAVDPSRFRLGIGRRLVRAALAAEPQAERAVVQTGALNEPAHALYLGEGFAAVDEIEPVPGLRVTRFAKRLR